jgi:hypothetical protein
MNTDSDQRYRILRSLNANGIALTKTLYAPGRFPVHHHENARLVFVLKGAFTENYASQSRHGLKSKKSLYCQPHDGPTVFRQAYAQLGLPSFPVPGMRATRILPERSMFQLIPLRGIFSRRPQHVFVWPA